MAGLSEEQLRALAVAQFDQTSAITRDALAKIPEKTLIGILHWLALAGGFQRTFEIMEQAPPQMKQLFSMLVMQSLSREICDRLDLLPKDGEPNEQRP